MAPRRRPKKKSNTRDAAAIDAMGQYGFHIDIIEETIKELLNVYGEDGWIFIEDCAYKVLLEAILEKVVKETGEGTSGSKKPAAETSSGTALNKVLACSDVNPINTESQIFNGLGRALEANVSLRPLQSTNEPEGMHLPPVDADVQSPCGSSNFIPPPSFNSPQQGSNSTVKAPPPSHHSPPPQAQSSNSKAKAPRPSHDSPTPPPQNSNSMEKAPPPSHGSPPPQASSSTTRRRRPYYGWVCSDDEEDLVELTPGPLAVEMEKYLLGFVERKQRWDIKPDDT